MKLAQATVALLVVAAVACRPAPEAVPPSTAPPSSAAADPRNVVTVTYEDVRLERGFMYITGSVTSRASYPVSFWKVAIKFYDEAGTVIDTDYQTSLGDTLGPGETKRFEVMHRSDKRIKNFVLSVEEVTAAHQK